MVEKDTNQYTYLPNLAKGTDGNAIWARDQLSKELYYHDTVNPSVYFNSATAADAQGCPRDKDFDTAIDWLAGGFAGGLRSAAIRSAGEGVLSSYLTKGVGSALVKDTGNIVKNTRNLRKWAKNKGWEQQFTDGGVEMWGVRNSDDVFSWRIKIKPEASTRPGLGTGSSVPRFDARLDASGAYINPFTGQIGGKAVGTHIPLGR